MTPDRCEAACLALESLAAGHLTAAYVADCLLWIPNTHAMRWVEHEGRMVDSVLNFSECVRRNKPSPEALRSFAAELRTQAPSMLRGWYAILHAADL